MAMFGDTLRQARTYKGATLKDAERVTRINRHHLAALEDENFGALPPLIYQRGIVRNYAAYLDLDAHKLVALFEEAHGNPPASDVVVAVKPLDMPSHWAPNFAIIAFMVVMSAIVFAWLYSAFFATEVSLPTPTAVATATPLPVQSFPTPIVTPDRGPTETPNAEASSPTAESEKASTRSRPSRSALDTSGGEGDAATEDPTEPATSTPTPDVSATRSAEATAAAIETEAAAVAGATQTAFAQTAIPITVSARDVGLGWVSIVADGASVFEGTLEPGQSTDQFMAQSYSIYTTDVGNTWITNHKTGQTFVMPGAGESSFSLP